MKKADKEHTHTTAEITDLELPGTSTLATKEELAAKADVGHIHSITKLNIGVGDGFSIYYESNGSYNISTDIFSYASRKKVK